MHTRSDDPSALQEFAASLGTRDPKTIATYLTTVRDFVAWLALQPGAGCQALSRCCCCRMGRAISCSENRSRRPSGKWSCFSLTR